MAFENIILRIDKERYVADEGAVFAIDCQSAKASLDGEIKILLTLGFSECEIGMHGEFFRLLMNLMTVSFIDGFDQGGVTISKRLDLISPAASADARICPPWPAAIMRAARVGVWPK